MILLKGEKLEPCSPVAINNFAHQIKNGVLVGIKNTHISGLTKNRRGNIIMVQHMSSGRGENPHRR